MYVHIFGYLVNKLEIWWVYLSPIGKKVFIYNSMQSRFWMDKIKGLPQIMSLFKSQDGQILWRVNLEWTKYRGIISWSDYMASGYIFKSSKKVTDYL